MHRPSTWKARSGIKVFGWRLVHRLPWEITRHVCDMCDEFPVNPRKLFRDQK